MNYHLGVLLKNGRNETLVSKEPAELNSKDQFSVYHDFRLIEADVEAIWMRFSSYSMEKIDSVCMGDELKIYSFQDNGTEKKNRANYSSRYSNGKGTLLCGLCC